MKTTKAQKITRYRKLLKQYSACLADCHGDEFATAEEQSCAVGEIIAAIRGHLRRLGVTL